MRLALCSSLSLLVFPHTQPLPHSSHLPHRDWKGRREELGTEGSEAPQYPVSEGSSGQGQLCWLTTPTSCCCLLLNDAGYSGTLGTASRSCAR